MTLSIRREKDRFPSGRTPQRSCFEAAITGSIRYKIGVTVVAAPILCFYHGFWWQNPMLAINADKEALVQT